MQRYAVWDHNGMFWNIKGVGLTGVQEGVLSEWQEMDLRKQAELHGGSHVPSQGSCTLASTLGKLKYFN